MIFDVLKGVLAPRKHAVELPGDGATKERANMRPLHTNMNAIHLVAHG